MSEEPAEKCARCGAEHTIVACPNVKAVEFDAFQRISRVEFLVPVDFHRQSIGEPAPDAYPKKGPA
jgi:hypothetical protein